MNPKSICNKPQKPKWWHYFFAGEIAGMAGSLSSHPFDTAKTKIQMLSEHKQSTFAFMRAVVIKEGVPGLWRGCLYPFFGYGVSLAITFGVNGAIQNHFMRQNEQDQLRSCSDLSMSQIAIAGSMAGIVQSFFTTPVERVKTWSQTHGTSTVQSTMDLLTIYGVKRGLLYGIFPTLVRSVPQCGVYYPVYEATCMLLSDSRDKTQMKSWKIFVSGASAGVWCWVIAYPIDVVMTRILAAPADTSRSAYRNMIETTKAIYRRGGFRLFWNGLMPTIYRATVLHSMVFLVYERTLESMQVHTGHHLQ
eukprot:26252_1